MIGRVAVVESAALLIVRAGPRAEVTEVAGNVVQAIVQRDRIDAATIVIINAAANVRMIVIGAQANAKRIVRPIIAGHARVRNNAKVNNSNNSAVQTVMMLAADAGILAVMRAGRAARQTTARHARKSGISAKVAETTGGPIDNGVPEMTLTVMAAGTVAEPSVAEMHATMRIVTAAVMVAAQNVAGTRGRTVTVIIAETSAVTAA